MSEKTYKRQGWAQRRIKALYADMGEKAPLLLLAGVRFDVEKPGDSLAVYMIPGGLRLNTRGYFGPSRGRGRPKKKYNLVLS